MWKRMSHPNVVQFRGVTLNPPQLVSDWMKDLMEFIKESPNTNRLGLVRVPPPLPRLHKWGSAVLIHQLAIRCR